VQKSEISRILSICSCKFNRFAFRILWHVKKFCEADQLRIFQPNGFLFNFYETRHFSDHCRPHRRAILVLIAVQAMTPNATAEHFDITRPGYGCRRCCKRSGKLAASIEKTAKGLMSFLNPIMPSYVLQLEKTKKHTDLEGRWF
jgi:hypothetical protein